MGKIVSNKDCSIIRKCRICGFKDIIPFLYLGNHPLANSLKEKINDSERKYPLTMVFCPKCSLVQLKETIRKEILFDKYIWFTGTSETARVYAEIFCKRIIKTTKVKLSDLIVEIASNDGTFLNPFVKRGYNAIGIEPAKNIAQIANNSGVKTLAQYWNSETADKIISLYGKAKVIIARNVIPHVSELHDAIRSIRHCLTDDGVGAIEFHSAGKILQDLHYDSIYHEHLCFFSIKTMKYLLNKFGLFPFNIDFSLISGGSYVIYFSKKQKGKSLRLGQLMNNEKRLSINSLKSWKRFSEKCLKHREKSKEILADFQGKTIVGFGASARSSIYMNFCGFTNAQIKAIIDNNPLKQGLFSAGHSIPIVSIEKGFRMKPDLLFVFAWNFKNEIIRDCERMGYKGTYLFPFPRKPHLLR